jgi:hypothetical protein
VNVELKMMHLWEVDISSKSEMRRQYDLTYLISFTVYTVYAKPNIVPNFNEYVCIVQLCIPANE